MRTVPALACIYRLSIHYGPQGSKRLKSNWASNHRQTTAGPTAGRCGDRNDGPPPPVHGAYRTQGRGHSLVLTVDAMGDGTSATAVGPGDNSTDFGDNPDWPASIHLQPHYGVVELFAPIGTRAKSRDPPMSHRLRPFSNTCGNACDSKPPDFQPCPSVIWNGKTMLSGANCLTGPEKRSRPRLKPYWKKRFASMSRIGSNKPVVGICHWLVAYLPMSNSINALQSYPVSTPCG